MVLFKIVFFFPIDGIQWLLVCWTLEVREPYILFVAAISDDYFVEILSLR